MNEGIENKVVLIIGGAGGIGAASARLLASRGARMAIADLHEARLAAVVESIAKAGGDVKGYRVDATDRDQVKTMVDSVVADFGRLDVLVGCAGVMYIRPMAELNTAEWETTIDLNIKSVLWGIAAALPVFQAQQSGHFINMGSVAGVKVFSPGGAVHSGSKFAVRAISEGLRSEVGEAIRVTTISPGAVDSGMQNKTTGSESGRIIELYRKAIPVGAVANAIAYVIEQPANVDVNEIVIRPTSQVQ
ncbi:SDR family NAD(P)-dependent oxidoreductase [Burkholderia gladioli]|uniref:SDR family oxidoreductase n=1 Tax=Burkholderia gladioli TaxID=28095 RepID=UPI001364A1D4|nr:SDR family oxidoreductase [Burkholderia gladioli]KAF1058458.1 putative oxidoreductase [Burkholderia gladioli]WAG22644.1 SDR family NAD(P)-dependent oxidoreductase [Burkholderia gladioli]